MAVLCSCIWKLTVSNIGWFWKLQHHRGVQDCSQCAVLRINSWCYVKLCDWQYYWVRWSSIMGVCKCQVDNWTGKSRTLINGTMQYVLHYMSLIFLLATPRLRIHNILLLSVMHIRQTLHIWPQSVLLIIWGPLQAHKVVWKFVLVCI